MSDEILLPENEEEATVYLSGALNAVRHAIPKEVAENKLREYREKKKLRCPTCKGGVYIKPRGVKWFGVCLDEIRCGACSGLVMTEEEACNWAKPEPGMNEFVKCGSEPEDILVGNEPIATLNDYDTLYYRIERVKK